ncbi:MAG: DnaJ domain-containing protein, partial [Chloroflexota bacterium]
MPQSPPDILSLAKSMGGSVEPQAGAKNLLTLATSMGGRVESGYRMPPGPTYPEQLFDIIPNPKKFEQRPTLNYRVAMPPPEPNWVTSQKVEESTATPPLASGQAQVPTSPSFLERMGQSELERGRVPLTPGVRVDPKTGLQYQSPPMGSIPLLDLPAEGAKQLWQGLTSGTRVLGGEMDPAMAGLNQPPPSREAMKAVSDVLQGTMKMGTVVVPAMVATAPFTTFAMFIAGALGGVTGEKIGKTLEWSPEATALAEEVGGIAGAVGTGGGIGAVKGRLRVYDAWTAMRTKAAETLGIPVDASFKTVQSAIRAIAKKTHPDMNRSPEAVPIFNNAVAAYEFMEAFKTPPVGRGIQTVARLRNWVKNKVGKELPVPVPRGMSPKQLTENIQSDVIPMAGGRSQPPPVPPAQMAELPATGPRPGPSPVPPVPETLVAPAVRPQEPPGTTTSTPPPAPAATAVVPQAQPVPPAAKAPQSQAPPEPLIPATPAVANVPKVGQRLQNPDTGERGVIEAVDEDGITVTWEKTGGDVIAHEDIQPYLLAPEVP